MKPALAMDPALERQLTFTLPTSDPEQMALQLVQVPALARHKPSLQYLHDVYYDSPDQTLFHQGVTLRIRRVGSELHPTWLQCLKTGSRIEWALCKRAKWESAVPSDLPSLDVLRATPWAAIDPDEKVFQALVPAFWAQFERTHWVLLQPDGSKLALALDIGKIVAGEKSAHICELELKLLDGANDALFEFAKQIASTTALLPACRSKVARGYALANHGLHTPLRAHPPELPKALPVSEAAARVLREMFCHFIGNLNAFLTSDDPEVVHQVRVAWRRFKSGLRLFKPALGANAIPPWQGLAALLTSLGELRDLDVAYADTLPQLGVEFAARYPQCVAAWQTMTQALMEAMQAQRKNARNALGQPAVGLALIAATQWLDSLGMEPLTDHEKVALQVPLHRWGKNRLARLHSQLRTARHGPQTPQGQHRVRILAKRLRYGIEALRCAVPKQLANRWHHQACTLQLRLGTKRDVLRALEWVTKFGAAPEIVEYLQSTVHAKPLSA